MTKKKLDVDTITNELEGASLFFSKPAVKDVPVPTETTPAPLSQTSNQQFPETVKKSVREKKKDFKQASMSASTLADNDDDMVEAVRTKVKQLGKEVVFLRLKPDEKSELSDLVYTLNQLHRGEYKKTTENEIGRIGLNYLLEDYKQNGERSILARVIKALNA